jgi:hypothetical protein
MAEIVQLKVAGVVRNAVEVAFEPAAEPWCEYRLVDGGRVRFRATAVKLFRLLDAAGKPALNNDGDPAYYVRYSTQTAPSG